MTPSLAKDEFTDVYVKYLASMCCTLMNLKHTSEEQWAEIRTLLSLLVKKLPAGADATLKAKCAEMMVAEEVDDDDEDAEELCNCQFTLAYGANLIAPSFFAVKRAKLVWDFFQWLLGWERHTIDYYNTSTTEKTR